MWFLSSIVGWLDNVSEYFYDAYLEVRGWIYPFSYLSIPLYYLYRAFNELAYYFGEFNGWLSWAADRIDSILDTWDIQSLLRDTIDAAINAWDWVVNAFRNVWVIVDEWWFATQGVVLAWVAEAKEYSKSLVDMLGQSLARLQYQWDNFKPQLPTITEIISWFSNWWGNIQANLETWWTQKTLEIQSLIDSAFILRSDFWLGWQEQREAIMEFISDPLQWLYNRIDEFAERFW